VTADGGDGLALIVVMVGGETRGEPYDKAVRMEKIWRMGETGRENQEILGENDHGTVGGPGRVTSSEKTFGEWIFTYLG